MSSLNRYDFMLYNVFLSAPHWSGSWNLKWDHPQSHLRHTHTQIISFSIWLQRLDRSACFHPHPKLKIPSWDFHLKKMLNFPTVGLKRFVMEFLTGKRAGSCDFHSESSLFWAGKSFLIQTAWKVNAITSEACRRSHLLPWLQHIYNHMYSFSRLFYSEITNNGGCITSERTVKRPVNWAAS